MLKHILFGSVIAALLFFGIDLYLKNIYNITADISDAPLSYGIAKHYKPEEGPYFGNQRGDNDIKSFKDTIIYATADNATGINDEDAFLYQDKKTDLNSNSIPFFVPEIIAEESSYTLTIPIKNAEVGDPVRGWIDFNGNGKFEEDEKAMADYKAGAFINLTWRFPLQLSTMLTYLRIRTCKKLYKEQIELPSSPVTSGEVEDYVVRIIKQTVPSAELKEYVDFTAFNGASGMQQTLPIINSLTLGSAKLSFHFSGPPLQVIGINNMHDGSVTGLRIGHEDTTNIDADNPITIVIKANKELENVNFQLIDVDGGDRIKIEGFKKGTTVPFEISNITDNYFYQFNTVSQEVYGDVLSDAGNGDIAASSLDMAINVSFIDFIDSIKLTYSDDGKGSSGTFTIGNFNIRKYNLPPIKIEYFTATEKDNLVTLNWALQNKNNIISYAIERSYDAKTYEIIHTSMLTALVKNNFSFVDNTLPPIVQCCYYRLRITESDNHINYSPVFRMRRTESVSTSGFKTESIVFTNLINIKLLVDMPGKIKSYIYDYEGEKLGEWLFEDKKAGEKLVLEALEKYPSNIYYIEIINNKKKYITQISK